MSDELLFTPAHELARLIRDGSLSPVELVDAHLDRIAAREDEVNAYITVLAERARERARAAERAVERGDLGPLHGVPVAYKDLSATIEGVRHTFGSAVYADNVADETAPFVQRLEDAGAVSLGKTNLPAFGHKTKTTNDVVGATSTPFDADRNAGGSSGGSAAAVADGQVALAQGGDAGGSVRIPSAFCGCYGIKPSFGRVPSPSRPDGFGTHTPFTDRGIHARTVADAALMLSVMAGPHPRDPFSLPDDGTEYRAAVERGAEDLSVAYTPDFGAYPIEDEVAEACASAVDDLAAAGATVDHVEVDLGFTLPELLEGTRYPIVNAKTAALAERLSDGDGVDVLGEDRDHFPDELVRRAEAGTALDATEFLRANRPRTAVYDAVQDLFEEYDVVASPTATVLPFPNDEPGPTEVDGVEVDPYAGWFPTFVFNLTGHPAASVPAGLTDDGLPVGLQLAGRRFADDDVLAASAALERVRPWQDHYPPG
jgi:Asp-tRNA(Asn)/Glu-tRNA(Gln) amidotransferase A subunit family amidase